MSDIKYDSQFCQTAMNELHSAQVDLIGRGFKFDPAEYRSVYLDFVGVRGALEALVDSLSSSGELLEKVAVSAILNGVQEGWEKTASTTGSATEEESLVTSAKELLSRVNGILRGMYETYILYLDSEEHAKSSVIANGKI